MQLLSIMFLDGDYCHNFYIPQWDKLGHNALDFPDI